MRAVNYINSGGRNAREPALRQAVREGGPTACTSLCRAVGADGRPLGADDPRAADDAFCHHGLRAATAVGPKAESAFALLGGTRAGP